MKGDAFCRKRGAMRFAGSEGPCVSQDSRGHAFRRNLVVVQDISLRCEGDISLRCEGAISLRWFLDFARIQGKSGIFCFFYFNCVNSALCFWDFFDTYFFIISDF